ncbi:hypothetical protein DP939_17845 [Spongiactinospora rosea]|uniref:Uncharacterized protein n=1 Tax=Spongiactinospora rosea TaxID=2248750 RepID=A0A366LZS0_9ACTN|nr:hypothetical protein [Spongiactinospora rosea]RBQ19033.1 hypothetical protein DP939_17845 [Spongiactinospora rosea]
MAHSDTTPRSGLVAGIAVGLIATVVGAGAYGAIVVITGRELGIAAIGIGVIIGVAMMAVRPTSPVLPVLAALFALIGCVLGQIGAVTQLLINELAKQNITMGHTEALTNVVGGFSGFIAEEPIMLLFWVISAAAGFSFVNNKVKAARAADLEPQAGDKEPGGPMPSSFGTPGQAPVGTPPQDDGAKHPGA